MFLAIAAMFAVLLIGFPIGSFVSPTYQPFVGPCCVMIGFPLMLIGFRKADVTYKEFSDLVCQHCQGGLYQSKSVIIATGNCPSCGRRVVKDDAIGT